MTTIDRPQLITFDVYSALLDISNGLTEALIEKTGLAEATARPLVAAWRAKQLERAASSNSLGRGHLPFRTCTELALDYVCARFNVDISHSVRHELVMAWDDLSPWPEANDALAKLSAAGYKLAILSNGDQQMLEAVSKNFTTSFDYIVSVQSAGYYKPHPEVYALPKKELGFSRQGTLHVAGSANDVLGAIAFGLPCVWSNRNDEPLLDKNYPPLAELSSLTAIPDFLTHHFG